MFRFEPQKCATIVDMKYVYVLEKEEKFRKDIHEALIKIDHQLQIRFFSELESFAKWINLVLQEGNKALAQGGFPLIELKEPINSSNDDQLLLLVTSDDMMGSHSMGLLKKTHQLFLRRGLCTAEMPTNIAITAFDDPGFDLSKTEDPIVNNVIFKPFDLMIMQQHLNNALNGRQPPKESNLHNMKMSASIEMLKNINMEAISQAGFVTVSDRPIQPGALSKYYAQEFLSGKTRSVMGKCVRCEPHPLLKDQFQVTLNFFGLEPNQIRDLRKSVAISNKPDSIMPYNWNNSVFRTSAHGLNMAILDEKKQGLSDMFQRNFVGAKVVDYFSWEKFHADFDPAQSPLVLQKNLPQDSGVKLRLDGLGHFVLGCEPQLKENEKIFDLSYEQFKKLDLGSCVAADSKPDWQNLMKVDGTMTVAAQRVIAFDINQQKKIVKVVQKEKLKTEDGNVCIDITLAELTTEEKINYLKSLSRWPEKVDIVIMTLEFHKKLTENNCKIPGKHFLLTDRNLTDAEERELGAIFQDIFVAPYDRNYLTMKIKMEAGMISVDDILSYRKTSFVQVANPIEVTEISEGGAILKYNRAMTIGSFRKFVLWSPSETELLEYTGTCNYTEAVEGEDPHVLNHFVFFGMKDVFLKNIRLWIRDNYIHSKEKAS